MKNLYKYNERSMYTKNSQVDPENFMVDPRIKTWNTFFEIISDWAPKLKKVYKDQEDLD